MQQLIAANMEYSSILKLEKSLFQHSLVVQIENLIRFVSM